MRIESLRDIEEIESVPLSARALPESTYEMLRRTAQRFPGRTALRFLFDGQQYQRSVDYSYTQLLGESQRMANLLHALGVGPKDVVSTVLPNLPETWFTILGAQTAGIVNPINPLLEPSVIAGILQAAGTKVLVTLGPFPQTDIWQKVCEAVKSVPSLEVILQVDLSPYVPLPKRWAAQALSWNVGRNLASPRATVRRLSEALQEYPKERLQFERKITSEDTAALFHTGGTTGIPKLAQHTHGNEVFDAFSVGCSGEWEGKTLFCGLPLFHVNAVVVTGMLAWLHGSCVVLGSPAGYRGPGIVQNLWKIIEHYRVAAFSAVPTVYSKLLELPSEGVDSTSLETCACGAAPLSVHVFRQFKQRTGLEILEGYGLTEGTCASALNPAAGEKRVGSVGLRLPYQELMIAELDDQGGFVRPCDIGEIGAVLWRGPQVFAGYRTKGHERGSWVAVKEGDKPWLNSGDLGRLDAEGYLWLAGRKKELIIRGGHNIDPSLIEEPLLEHPAVALVAAVGRPDAHAGEVPVAYVQLGQGKQASSEQLLEFARKTIGERAAHPKAIHVVDELPLTAVGKVFKPALIDREVESVFVEALRNVDSTLNVRVESIADAQYGRVAHVYVGKCDEGLLQRIEEELGRFAVRFEIHSVGAGVQVSAASSLGSC